MVRTSSTSGGRRSLNVLTGLLQVGWHFVEIRREQAGQMTREWSSSHREGNWPQAGRWSESRHYFLRPCRVVQSRASLPCWEEQQVTLQSCGEEEGVVAMCLKT